MTEYVPPEWGKEGKNLFDIFIDVIKGGIVVENLKLPFDKNKSYVVAGRMEPLCDLVLQHPSISRTHAGFQFDEYGALFLMDFKSTHGTFVNKERIDPHDFKRLHIGDIVSFGESSRLYAICGPQELLPAEYDSLNLQKFRERLQKKKEAQEKNRTRRDKEVDEGEGISWGFGEDAEEESSEEEDKPEDKEESNNTNKKRNLPSYLRNMKEEESTYTSSISKQDYNEKDSKLIQQLQTRIKKMENLKEEKKKILAKQNTTLAGLTEGQEKQIERNEQRIQTLMEEIKSIELKIHAKNQQRQVTKTQLQQQKRKRQGKYDENENAYDYASDEDDFYDRTKANKSHPISPIRRKIPSISESKAGTSPRETNGTSGGNGENVLTASSIQKKISQLESELKRLETKQQQIQMAIDEKQVPGAVAKEEMDSLDSYMQSTTQELQEEWLTLTQTKRLQVEKELETQRHLLQVAMPALPKFSMTKTTTEEQQQEEKQEEKHTKQFKKDLPISPSSSPFPSPKIPIPSSETIQKPTSSTSSQLPSVAVENPKKRVLGADLGPLSSSSCKDTIICGTQPETKKKKKKTKSKPIPLLNDPNILEGGEKVWIPPIDQTGDGRTKLNDKYGY